MITISPDFAATIHRLWGSPEAVANAGINETFRQPDGFGFDHDDQVDNAMRIGVLAGKSATADEFLVGFAGLTKS